MWRSIFGLPPIAHEQELRTDEFWAIRNISFDLRRGEALGIVGLNGAGKSTLLKLLLGRHMPDEGSIRVTGKAGGLVELGAGFHPELSGRRNILIGAALAGATEAEAAAQMEAIVAFADIGRFIDAPVKTYSSGMRVRLGFAIAIHFIPDVLVCDEVLAVGDFEFRQKCLHRIKEIRKTRSVVLVSHSSADIALFCDRAMLLHRGELIAIDQPEVVLKAYAVCTNHLSAAEVRRRSAAMLANRTTTRPAVRTAPLAVRPVAPVKTQSTVASSGGPPPVEISDERRLQLFGPEYPGRDYVRGVSFRWTLEKNEKGHYLISGEACRIELAFELLKPVERFRIGFPIFDELGTMLLGPDSRYSPEVSSIQQPGAYRVSMLLDPMPINRGRYWPAIALNDDPAHLFRKHLPHFDVYNPAHEFGVAKTFSVWAVEADADPSLPLVFSV